MTDKKDIKFYMNNPCVVLREVSGGEFLEIKMNPEYGQSMDGSEFCQGCILGSMDGAHPSHSCEDYENIIDAINDQEASILVIAEARLVNDKPVELIKYEYIVNEVKKQQARHNELFNMSNEERLKTSEFVSKQKELQKNIEVLESQKTAQEKQLENLKVQVYEARKKYQESIKLASHNGLFVDGKELKSLYRDSYILNELQNNGVDNWSYYGDAMPNEDDIEDYCQAVLT